MPTTNSSLYTFFYTFQNNKKIATGWQKFFLFFNVPKSLHKQVSTWHTTSLSLRLPPGLTKSCCANLVTLSPPHGPFLTLAQLLFKAVCFSTYASWHKYRSDLLATSTGCVPGKHRATAFTRRGKKKRKKKNLASVGSCRVKRTCKPRGKTDKKKHTQNWHQSFPPAVWLGWQLNSRQEN